MGGRAQRENSLCVRHTRAATASPSPSSSISAPAAAAPDTADCFRHKSSCRWEENMADTRFPTTACATNTTPQWATPNVKPAYPLNLRPAMKTRSDSTSTRVRTDHSQGQRGRPPNAACVCMDTFFAETTLRSFSRAL